jgi:hypothetical protein
MGDLVESDITLILEAIDDSLAEIGVSSFAPREEVARGQAAA